MTPLDLLIEALRRAGDYAVAAEAAPEVVLWCDPAAEFAPVLPALRAAMPGLLTLGDYDPAARTGPALWLRAAAVRRVPGVDWPAGELPVLHLPGVARDVLRGAEDCPEPLRLLVWFAVAGAFFGQPKQSRDWTLRGFLAAGGSPVGLDVPEDAATRTALAAAACRLFTEPVATLRGRRLDAAALNGLLVDDPDDAMLAWIDGTLQEAADPERFAAFAGLAAKRFGLDPRKRTREDAAKLLAGRGRDWAKVWTRFVQVSSGYDEVVRLLGFHEPQDLLAPEAYPSENRKREVALRATLLALADQSPAAARSSVLALEGAHHWRRETVWAKRGEARLAQALAHLVAIANAPALPSHDAAALAEAYSATGWKVDAAALAALAAAQGGEDRAAVISALRTLYLPWLGAAADGLQALATGGKVPFAVPAGLGKPAPGDVLLFVDGLRIDLAHRLAELLRAAGATVRQDWRWSGFPTVTATCKPLASPASGLLVAGPPAGLLPLYGDKAATKPVLTKAVEAAGWATDAILLPDTPLWLEGKSIDQAGEANGAQVLPLLPGIFQDIVAAVMLHAGQGRRVRIVTDHGFLLMPGGLPKADMPGHLVEPATRARRVALLKEGAASPYPLLPWSWDGSVLLATPPGARAFYPNVEYAHGGVSPQECVLPVLDVTAAGAAPRLEATVGWTRLRAKVRVDGGASLVADIRVGDGASGPSALVRGPKVLDDDGEASVFVDDAHEGQPVCLVIYRRDAPDRILVMLPTKAGE